MKDGEYVGLRVDARAFSLDAIAHLPAIAHLAQRFCRHTQQLCRRLMADKGAFGKGIGQKAGCIGRDGHSPSGSGWGLFTSASASAMASCHKVAGAKSSGFPKRV